MLRQCQVRALAGGADITGRLLTIRYTRGAQYSRPDPWHASI